jgi:hypothetical protein
VIDEAPLLGRASHATRPVFCPIFVVLPLRWLARAERRLVAGLAYDRLGLDYLAAFLADRQIGLGDPETADSRVTTRVSTAATCSAIRPTLSGSAPRRPLTGG